MIDPKDCVRAVSVKINDWCETLKIDNLRSYSSFIKTINNWAKFRLNDVDSSKTFLSNALRKLSNNEEEINDNIKYFNRCDR